jgi:hypothetical protein
MLVRSPDLSRLTIALTFVVSYLTFFTEFTLGAKSNDWRVYFFAAFQTIRAADSLSHYYRPDC